MEIGNTKWHGTYRPRYISTSATTSFLKKNTCLTYTWLLPGPHSRATVPWAETHDSVTPTGKKLAFIAEGEV